MALFTLFALMNVLVAFNAHQYLCLTNLYIDRLSIVSVFYIPHVFVRICLIVWYYIMHCDVHSFVYTLFCSNTSDWLLFCHVIFPEPPPQYSEWTVGPLSSATCPSLFMQFSGCHQPVQRFYWSENPIDWVGEC